MIYNSSFKSQLLNPPQPFKVSQPIKIVLSVIALLGVALNVLGVTQHLSRWACYSGASFFALALISGLYLYYRSNKKEQKIIGFKKLEPYRKQESVRSKIERRANLKVEHSFQLFEELMLYLIGCFEDKEKSIIVGRDGVFFEIFGLQADADYNLKFTMAFPNAPNEKFDLNVDNEGNYVLGNHAYNAGSWLIYK